MINNNVDVRSSKQTKRGGIISLLLIASFCILIAAYKLHCISFA